MRLSLVAGLAAIIAGGIFFGRTVVADRTEVVLTCKGTNGSGDGFQASIERTEHGYQARIALIEKLKLQSPEAPFPIDDPIAWDCGKITYDASPRFKLTFTPPTVKPHKPGSPYAKKPHRPNTAEADYAKSPVRHLEGMECR